MLRKENRITRLNYNERAKAALGLAFFGILAFSGRFYDRNPGADSINLPPVFRGRIFDGFSSILAALYSKFLLNENKFVEHTIVGMFLPCFLEMIQFLGIDGTFDLGDLVAYGVGVSVWMGFDKSAQALYDSNLTKPIYKVMRIQDRRNVRDISLES